MARITSYNVCYTKLLRKQFTGIDDPYEAPEQPEIHLHNHGQPVEEGVAELLAALRARGLLPA